MTVSKIPLAGVIGSPIAHSKSPQLHRHWLEVYGIKGHYIPMDVAADDLEIVLRTLPKMGFVGVNVTLPHKEAILQIADVVSDQARRIGAANTLVFDPNKGICADNTDGYGFVKNLQAGAPNWTADSGPAVVLGAGGAARAVIVALLDEGVSRIILSNRTQSRAENLKSEFGNRIDIVGWNEVEATLDEASLVVNTSSLGMLGHPELPVSLDALRPETVVTDLVYNPLQTKLLQTASHQGCTAVDGLGMLLHQGVPGFEHWFGQRPAVTEETRQAVLA